MDRFPSFEYIFRNRLCFMFWWITNFLKLLNHFTVTSIMCEYSNFSRFSPILIDNLVDILWPLIVVLICIFLVPMFILPKCAYSNYNINILKKKKKKTSLGREDPLEKGIATHSSILVWRTLWTEEPGRLQYKGWK